MSQTRYSDDPEIRKIQEHAEQLGIYEIILNPDQRVWVDSFEKGSIDTGMKISPATSKRMIYDIAAISGQVILPDLPILDRKSVV